jgi:hypothetical protein
MTHPMKRRLTIAALSATFAAGYVCGLVTQRPADAQVKELGGAMMKSAGESGGALGSAAKLGTAVTDMQEHVTGLQKNLETLKSIQAALGG